MRRRCRCEGRPALPHSPFLWHGELEEPGGDAVNTKIPIATEQLALFCRERHIRRLAVFGSALRSDFGADSDVDVLVEFEPEHVPGLFGISRMERELSPLFGGRKVDLRTPEDLSRYFRERVSEEAEVHYARG